MAHDYFMIDVPGKGQGNIRIDPAPNQLLFNAVVMVKSVRKRVRSCHITLLGLLKRVMF